MITVKANSKKYLTQKEVVNESERLFLKEIKGVNVSQEDWREALEQEKESWETTYLKMEIPD